MPTHEVLNQAPPLQDHDPFALDLVLQETLRREGAAWAGEGGGGVAPPAGGPGGGGGRGRGGGGSPAGRGAARPLPGASRPTRTRRGCARTTGSAIASTRWSSIPPGTS